MFKRKYNLDEGIFSKLESRNSYWIGFLWGDGYMNGNRLQLCLSYKDYDHLVKFRNFMRSPEINIKVFDSKNKKKNIISKSCEIRFRSWKIYNDLKRYKIVLNKTDRGKVPEEFYKKIYRRMFLRGLFDADGCFTIDSRGYLFSEITGDYETVLYAKEITEKEIGAICNIVKNGSIYRIRLSASDTLKLGDYIYKDKTENEFLNRKYNRFIKHKKYLLEGKSKRLYTKNYEKEMPIL